MTLPSTQWTLLEGAQLCALLEPDLRRAGAHVALAGSVLTHGRSTKDLDLHIYPHQTSAPFGKDELLLILGGHGFEFARTVEKHDTDNEYLQDAKFFATAMWCGKRVDFFLTTGFDCDPRNNPEHNPTT